MATSKKIMTKKFRVSYAQVFEPKSFENGPLKYSLMMIFPKGTDLSDMEAGVKEVMDLAWPDVSKRPKNLKLPFKIGNEEKPDDPNFADTIYVKADTKADIRRPQIVDAQKQPIESSEEFYSGCYAIASVYAVSYDMPVNKGIKFVLGNVQKLADGERLGGGTTADQDFQVQKDEAVDMDNLYS